MKYRLLFISITCFSVLIVNDVAFSQTPNKPPSIQELLARKSKPLPTVPSKNGEDEVQSEEVVTGKQGEKKEVEKEKKREYRQSGTLASSMSTQGRATTDTWTDTDPTGEEAQPIDGSISNLGANKWQMRLFNNSKTQVSTSVAVVQISKEGKETKKSVYSFTIQPGEKVERIVSTNPTTASCRIDLLNWKAAKKQKKESKEGGTTEESELKKSKDSFDMGEEE